MYDYVDMESTQKTSESYLEEMEWLFTICPKIERAGEAINSRAAFPQRFRAPYGALGDLMPHVTGITANTEDLFNFRQPKIILPSYFTWQSTFFKLDLVVERVFEFFIWAHPHAPVAAYVDDDGIEHEAKPGKPRQLDTQLRTITLHLRKKSWGLGKWSQNRGEIANFCNAAPPSVIKRYQEAFEDADDMVSRWQNSMGEVAKIAASVREKVKEEEV